MLAIQNVFFLLLSDRVVDDLNPVLTFTKREVESLLHFVEEEPDPSRVLLQPHDNMESVLKKALHIHRHLITKVEELVCVVVLAVRW